MDEAKNRAREEEIGWEAGRERWERERGGGGEEEGMSSLCHHFVFRTS